MKTGSPKFIRRAADLVGWIVPSTILTLIPKCPMCLATYIALWTGIGLSISAAIFLRASLLIVCAGLILFLAARNARRLMSTKCNREKIIVASI